MKFVLIVRVKSICVIVNGIEYLVIYLRNFSLIPWKGIMRREFIGKVRKIDQLVELNKSRLNCRQLLSNIDIKELAISDILALS